MTTATIFSKGRITIPADVRQALGVSAGDRVQFVQIKPGEFLFFAANHSVTELKGMFGSPVRVVSVEDMNRAVEARGASKRGRTLPSGSEVREKR